MTMTNPTEEMVAAPVEIEEVLSCLDRHACSMGPVPFDAFSRWYKELIDMRETQVREWNEEASCGLHDVHRMLYRCDEASRPYHTVDNDGPCEVWTPNWDASAGKGAVSLCALHQQMAEEVADEAEAGRMGYLEAKQRGEDV